MKKFLFPILLFLILFSSCKKDEEDNDAAAAIDHSIANSFFNDLYKVIDEAAGQTEGIRALECDNDATLTIGDLSINISI